MILDSKTGKKFVGFYRGQVMSHLGNGACKIWIPGVYPESWCETASETGMVDAYGQPLRGAKLPTAYGAMPPFGGTIDEGFYAMPAINSTVWCFFENEDSNFPIYFANATSKNNTMELDSLTESTDPKPIGDSAARANPRLKRDVILRFGAAYIKFMPNKGLEIGFEADKVNKNAIEEAKSKAENSGRANPKIIFDEHGRITITSGSSVRIDCTGDDGVAITSKANEVKASRNGISVFSGEGSGISIMGDRTVSINSNRVVDIQEHQAMYNNLTGHAQ